MKTEFPEIKIVAQEKGTANWHIETISKVASSNLQLLTQHLASVQEVPVVILVLGKKITGEMSNLPARIFFFLNHLFKFIRALASSFVHSSPSTECQKELI